VRGGEFASRQCGEGMLEGVDFFGFGGKGMDMVSRW
jgi:hypothetical protein